MNKIILMGRLMRDPEIRYSQGETLMAIARYSLAVDKRKKRDDGVTADFFRMEHVTDVIPMPDFVEVHGRAGGDDLCYRVYDNGEIYEK